MKQLFAIGGIALALLLSACATGEFPKGSTDGQLKQEAEREAKGG